MRFYRNALIGTLACALSLLAGQALANVTLSFSSVAENTGAGDYSFDVFARNATIGDIRITSFTLPFDVKTGFLIDVDNNIGGFSVQHPENSDGVFPMTSVNDDSPFFSVLFGGTASTNDQGLALGAGETGKLFNFTLNFDGSQSGAVEAASLTTGAGAIFSEILIAAPGDDVPVGISTEGLSPSIGISAVPEPSSLLFCGVLGTVALMRRRRRR